MTVEHCHSRARDRCLIEYIRIRPRAPGTMKDKDVIVRINADSCDGAEHLAIRENGPTVNNVVAGSLP